MVRAEDHIGYQPSNEHTRFQHLLKSINYTYIRIVSAITTFLGDNIKRGNFEQASDFILLATSVRKNDTSDNKHHILVVNDKGYDNNKQASGNKGF